MQEENTALSIAFAVSCSPWWRDAEEITPENLSPRKRHSATSAWTAEKCRSRRGICPSTLITKCSLFFHRPGLWYPWGHKTEARTPLLRDECQKCLCCDWELCSWCVDVTSCEVCEWQLPCSPWGHKVCEGAKASPGVGLLSLDLLVSCKITAWVHLGTTAGLRTLPLNKQQQHQICSLKALSLCWVSAQGRHSKHVNDFGQHVALAVIAFTVILETLKWLQQMHFVAHPGTVVLPFIIYLYLALFHNFLCFNVCFILVSEGLFLVLEGTRLLIWPQARCFLSIRIINKSRIKKS